MPRAGDKLLFKKPRNKIESLIKNQLLKRRLTRERKEPKKEDFLKKLTKNLKKTLPIPIMMGIVACLLMLMFFGAKQLFETLLSWIIGMTLIAFLITSVLSKHEKSM